MNEIRAARKHIDGEVIILRFMFFGFLLGLLVPYVAGIAMKDYLPSRPQYVGQLPENTQRTDIVTCWSGIHPVVCFIAETSEGETYTASFRYDGTGVKWFEFQEPPDSEPTGFGCSYPALRSFKAQGIVVMDCVQGHVQHSIQSDLESWAITTDDGLWFWAQATMGLHTFFLPSLIGPMLGLILSILFLIVRNIVTSVKKRRLDKAVEYARQSTE